MVNVRHFARDVHGASSAEYALILALIGLTLAVGAVVLEHSISCSFQRSGDVIATKGQSSQPNWGNSNPQGNANGHRKRC